MGVRADGRESGRAVDSARETADGRRSGRETECTGESEWETLGDRCLIPSKLTLYQF